MSTTPGITFTLSTSCLLRISSLRRSGPLITNWTAAFCEPPPPITATSCTEVRMSLENGGRISLRMMSITTN